ncbi:MAG: peptidoglycan DD-metalloendopeptidase family protein [Bacteroidaceae bacterium]|nr:peptidoglycan DD-metalloendopeptidase family protein [Bacteroidaceae bacterium]
MMSLRLTFVLFVSFWMQFAFAQSSKKIKELENQRGELLEQIEQSETLLLSTKKDVKSQLSDLNLMNSRIGERKKLIASIEKDIRTLDEEVLALERQMKQLETELNEKQQKYASSVLYMRKNRSIHEKLMFIFSAQTLNQTYRRLRYVNEYATFQRVQGEQIKEKQQQVIAKKQEVLLVKGEKANLLQQRTEEQRKMEEQEKQQRALVAKLQKKQRGIQSELNRQRKEQKRLNDRIDRLIEEEIAAAKRRAAEEERKRKAEAAKQKQGSREGHKVDASVKPIDKSVPMMDAYNGDLRLSSNFEQNRGRLPVPIEGAYAVVGHFGQYNVQGLKNVRLDNKGIDIRGKAGTQACAVFDGEVSAVFQDPSGRKTWGVLIRHGNYISVYFNLATTTVKKGQKVKTRAPIGKVAVDASGSTVLHFQLRKEKAKLNPERWLKL